MALGLVAVAGVAVRLGDVEIDLIAWEKLPLCNTEDCLVPVSTGECLHTHCASRLDADILDVE
jgi:hypothetical protein